MSEKLYYAYVRFLRALRELDHFCKEEDFYKNMASLEHFIWEYRRIIVAVKEQFTSEKDRKIYEQNRNRYLAGWPWIFEWNDGTVREVECIRYRPGGHPFTKSLRLTSPPGKSLLGEKEGMAAFLDDGDEIFFSARFSFREEPGGRFLTLHDCIEKMWKFIQALEKESGEGADSYRRLKWEILPLLLHRWPDEMIFSVDYAYSGRMKTFKRAKCSQLRTESYGRSCWYALEEWESVCRKAEGSLFEKFAVMNMDSDIKDFLPAIMVIREDGRFCFDLFTSDLQTTLYRKLDETAEWVRKGEAREVYCRFLYEDMEENGAGIPEVKLSRDEGPAKRLVFARVDRELEETEAVFDVSRLKDKDYVKHILTEGKENRIRAARVFMEPICAAFFEMCYQK